MNIVYNLKFQTNGRKFWININLMMRWGQEREREEKSARLKEIECVCVCVCGTLDNLNVVLMFFFHLFSLSIHANFSLPCFFDRFVFSFRSFLILLAAPNWHCSFCRYANLKSDEMPIGPRITYSNGIFFLQLELIINFKSSFLTMCPHMCARHALLSIIKHAISSYHYNEVNNFHWSVDVWAGLNRFSDQTSQQLFTARINSADWNCYISFLSFHSTSTI